LSVILADLDYFKSINDQYGHQIGDEVLIHFVAQASGVLRDEIDWVARFGGEEFVVVLPGIGLAAAVTVAEQIRARCANAVIATEAGDLKFTASFGVATLSATRGSNAAAATMLLREADAALYRSKREGRNRITGADRL
jgi:diguanylate cyclase (GGDEF)-like protein